MSVVPNDISGRAEGLAATLRRLKVGKISASDLEWMYAFPDASQLLDAIATTFSAGAATCVLPESILAKLAQEETAKEYYEASHLPPQYGEYIFPSLPAPEEYEQESVLPCDEALEEAGRAAEARVRALKEQKAALLRALREESDVSDSEGSESNVQPTAHGDTAEEQSAQLLRTSSELRAAAAGLVHSVDATARWARERNDALSTSVAAYKTAESSVLDQAVADALKAWRSVTPASHPEAPQASRVAEAAAQSAAQRTEAAIALARATGALQAMKSGSHENEGGPSGERLLERAREEAAAAEERVVKRAADEARAYVEARAGGVQERARMRAAEARVEQGRQWADNLVRAVCRAAVAVEVLRVAEETYREGFKELDTRCRALSECFAGETSEANFTRKAFIQGSENSDHAKGEPVDVGSVENSHEALEVFEEAERKSREASDAVHRAKTTIEDEVWGVALRARLEVEDLTLAPDGSVERSEIMARGLRDAGAGVNEAGKALGELLEERRRFEENVGGAEGRRRGAWIRFLSAFSAEGVDGSQLSSSGNS